MIVTRKRIESQDRRLTYALLVFLSLWIGFVSCAVLSFGGVLVLALVANDSAVQAHLESTPLAVAYVVPIDTPTPIPTDATLPSSTHTPVPSITSTDLPTVAPTNTQVPFAPTETTSSDATAAIIPTQLSNTASISRGIGITRSEWESVHGLGETVDIFTKYNNDDGSEYSLIYVNDKATDVRYETTEELAQTWQDMHDFTVSFIPQDAEFINSYTPEDRPNLSVSVYHSNWLAGRFSIEEGWIWHDEQPGTFFLLEYVFDDGKTTSFLVATGNNP